MRAESESQVEAQQGRSVQLDAKAVELARSGNLHALLKLKETLRPLPADEAFAAFRHALELAPEVHVRFLHARSMQAAASSQASFYLETGAAGLPVVCKAPRSLGEGSERDLHWRSRTAYVACFRNARIRSRSHAI